MDRHKEYAYVCSAMLDAMGALKTWYDIKKGADSLRHVHLRFRLLDEDCRRHEQEGGASPRHAIEEAGR